MERNKMLDYSNGASFDALADGSAMCLGSGGSLGTRPVGHPPSAEWMFKAEPIFRLP
jgi:hypothetical protein